MSKSKLRRHEVQYKARIEELEEERDALVQSVLDHAEYDRWGKPINWEAEVVDRRDRQYTIGKEIDDGGISR